MFPVAEVPSVKTDHGDLAWRPNSLYLLRDPSLAGEILAVEERRLTGGIIRSADIVWLNDRPNTPASSFIEVTEWDLQGNHAGSRTYDLMALVRRPVW